MSTRIKRAIFLVLIAAAALAVTGFVVNSRRNHNKKITVDVVLAAELDGEADLGFVQADEDEGGFGDGLGGPVGGDQPGKLDEAAVAVAAGLALVEEVFGPKFFESGEVGVRLWEIHLFP